jgi:Mrp family chromosome partitioning ATPase
VAIAATVRALRSVEDPSGPAADGLRARLSTLRATTDDPSLSVVSDAAVPSAPAGPPARLVVGFALIAGFSLGAIAAVLAELLTPRPVRDERDLASVYPLPILARVPGSSRAWRRSRRRVRASAMREGFRSLRSQLALSARDQTRGQELERMGAGQRDYAARVRGRNGTAVLITSSSRGDGRSSATLALARAAVAGEQQVLLIDFDLRGSGVSAIERVPRGSLRPLLTGAPLATVLAPLPGIPGARILATPPDLRPHEVEALMPQMAEIITTARLEADWVIVDAPPLGEFPDALPILAAVDQTVVVARAGHTSRAALARLGGVLGSADASRPAGYLFIERTPMAALTRAYDGTDLPPDRARTRKLLAR